MGILLIKMLEFHGTKNGIFDKDCFMFVEGYNSTDKEMDKGLQFFDFCTVALGLCSDASLPYTINGICSLSL